MKLTKATVSRLKLRPGRSETIVFDESLPGFGLRMRAGGKRTWITQYRLGSKQRRVTIGTVETLDADEARRRLGGPVPRSLVDGLTPGDFATVRRKRDLFGAVPSSVLADWLDEEAAAKETRTKVIGFLGAHG